MIKNFIDATPLPAIAVSQDERIEASNASAARLLGAHAIGRHYIAIIRQPPLLDAIEAALSTGKPMSAQFLSTEGQKDMTWKAHVAAVGDTGSVLVMFEDRSALDEATEMRRDFVANVSHELRTPLTALLGFIETLRGAARDDAETRARFLAIMAGEASRMNRLVQDLLSLNRVEAEERIRPDADVDLAAQTRSVLNALAPVALESGVEMSATGLEAPMIIAGDADQLAQVATNLIENAIKYAGRDRSVHVSIEKVDRHPMVHGPAIILGVADTGDGIDPIHIPRLTERFYRIDNHRSREMGGTGLGLAIVKHIVNRHRGRLRIESEPGAGTKFLVILPLNQ